MRFAVIAPRWSICSVLLVLAAVRGASAQAPREVDCLEYSSGTVTAQGGSAVQCTMERCALVADPKGKAIEVKPPKPAPPPKPASPLQEKNGKPSVCNDQGCTALGPKLRAAIDAARKARGGGKAGDDRLLVTRDRRMVVLDESPTQFWSVERDQPFEVKPPPKTHGDFTHVQILGDRLLVTWNSGCPGLCVDDAAVVEHGGALVGSKISSGELVLLDKQAFVIPTGFGKVTALDLATGKQLGQVDLVPRGILEHISVTRLDATTAAVAWRINGSPWKLAWLGATKDKPTVRTRSFEICPP